MKRACLLLTAAVLVAACSTTPPPSPRMRYLTRRLRHLVSGCRRLGRDQADPGRQAARGRVLAREARFPARHRSSSISAGQKAFFYKAGKLVGMSPISSGREGYRTPTGRFSIIQKDRNHLSTLYGDYVDSSRERRCEERGRNGGSQAAWDFVSRRANAVFYENLWRSRHACRLPSGGSRFPWVHPFAAAYGCRSFSPTRRPAPRCL